MSKHFFPGETKNHQPALVSTHLDVPGLTYNRGHVSFAGASFVSFAGASFESLHRHPGPLPIALKVIGSGTIGHRKMLVWLRSSGLFLLRPCLQATSKSPTRSSARQIAPTRRPRRS